LLLEIVERKNAAEFYRLDVENPIFRNFLKFSAPKMRGKSCLANFSVVGKPINAFLIAVH